MPDASEQFFRAPMARGVLMVFFLGAVLAAAAIAWSFKAGFLWTGICLIVVTAPLTGLYWFMLFVNPSRSHAAVLDEGLHIQAPPFFTASLPYAAIHKIAEADMAEERYRPGQAARGMHFGTFHSGLFSLARDAEDQAPAHVLSCSNRALFLETDQGRFLIGPADLDGFQAALAARLGS